MPAVIASTWALRALPTMAKARLSTLEGVLDRQPHLELGQPGVGQVELERLVALGRKLERDRVDERAFLARLVRVVAVELGLGLDLLGAEVVDAAEELVDVGLLVVDPGLEGDDRHVVGRVVDPGLGVGAGRALGRRRIGGRGRADHHDLGLEVAQAEALDVGEAAVGVDLELGRDQGRGGDHALADLLRGVGQPGRDLEGLAERGGRLGRLDGVDPLRAARGLSPV